MNNWTVYIYRTKRDANKQVIKTRLFKRRRHKNFYYGIDIPPPPPLAN